jgi:hypothetical protein
MTERRRLAEELGHDIVAGDEQVDRLDAGSRSSVHEILALDREQAGLVPVLPRREKLPDEPELLVLS